jgi:hypothetical protein
VRRTLRRVVRIAPIVLALLIVVLFRAVGTSDPYVWHGEAAGEIAPRAL